MADTDTRRLEQILGAVLIELMGNASQQEKIVRLRRAGYSNVEIADLLGTSSASVAQAHYEAGKSKRPSPPKKKPKTK
jgi:DNA-binding NarL/FixJ family response regulator